MRTSPRRKRAASEEIRIGRSNVFVDLGFLPNEASELKVKADLAVRLFQRIRELGLTQTRAAERMGISQPDVSKLLGGRVSGFSIDRLLFLLNRLQVDIDIVVRPKSMSRKHRTGVVRVLERASA